MRITAWILTLLLLTMSRTAEATIQDARHTSLREGSAVLPNPAYDGRFTFARLWYGGKGCFMSEGPGWRHDYPVAERNLMKIMNDLMDSFDPRIDSSVVFAPDDPELTKYPVAYLSEPGCWKPTESEVQGLRNYLLKGGFLIVDDFRGSQQWNNFETQMLRVLPEGRFVPIDRSDPLFDGFFDLTAMEVGNKHSQFQGLYEKNDATRRLMVVANYNLDIGDFWQWSPDGLVPVAKGSQAYKFGLNYIVYGLSH